MKKLWKKNENCLTFFRNGTWGGRFQKLFIENVMSNMILYWFHFFKTTTKTRSGNDTKHLDFYTKLSIEKLYHPFPSFCHSPYIWFPCHNFSICFSSTIKKKLYSHCVVIFLNQLNYLYTLIACNNYHSKWSK